MPRVLSLALVAALCLAAGATIGAAAAGLTVTTSKLTVATAATSVPISQCTLSTSTADTYADAALLLLNFGTAADLNVRSQLATDQRAFVKFDLSSCSLASTAEIKTASLQLLLSTAPGATRTYGSYRVTQSWDETTLTWNAQPTTAASATSTTATGTTSGVTLSWNVQADVAAFVAGTATNDGWLVRDQSEGATPTGPSAVFGARERTTASERPKLVITYYP